MGVTSCVSSRDAGFASHDAVSATNLTISGNNASRVILTEGGTDVTLKNLIVANGKVSGTDPNNDETSAGGGIQTGGNLT